MDDLISIQAAINWIINLSADIGKIQHQDLWHYEQALDEIRALLEQTAEPRTGNWIVHKSPDEYHCGMVECPFCREELIAEPNEYCYCPNCGAKMEESE